GPLPGLATAVGMVALLACWHALLAARLRAQATRQLPGFLESMVRLASVGHSLASAFSTIAQETPAPLGPMLRTALSGQMAGMELDQMLERGAERHGIAELRLLAAALRVAARFGGHPEKLVGRVAALLRTREATRAELLALTAEVRLSAWLLCLLPVGIAFLLFGLNPDYARPLLDDPTGHKLLAGAIGLQITGALLLWRMTKSV
ncbi:type II secretion system F family protein, partial [Chitiniphilus eburneus]